MFTNTNPSKRNSRRALILQMAKARMKSNKPMATNEKAMANKNGGLMGGLELD